MGGVSEQRSLPSLKLRARPKADRGAPEEMNVAVPKGMSTHRNVVCFPHLSLTPERE